MSVYDFVIVGAGAAGLAAGLELVDAGASVVILEARARVGGRTCVEHVRVGESTVAVDVGGQWIGPPQKNIMDLVEKYNLPLNEQFDEGTHILEIDGEKIEYTGVISDLRVLKGGHLERMWALLDALAETADPTNSAQDLVSMKEWLDENSDPSSPASRFLIEWFLRVCVACEPEQLSLLAFIVWMKTAGGSTPLIDIKDGAQNFTLVGGMQQLSECMAREFQEAGGTLLLGAPVSAIDYQSGVQVFLRPPHFDVIRARKIIVAMSPVLVQGIAFTPPLPAAYRSLSQRMTTGSIIKCLVFFDTPFWKERGLSGELITNGFPVSLTYDRSEGDTHALVAFIAGNASLRCSTMIQEERKTLVVQQLANSYGIADLASRVVHYTDHDWSQEEFSGGCYFSYFNLGSLAPLHSTLSKPVQQTVYFAGTEYSPEWVGYIEGAIVSGKKAARQAMAKTAKL